MENINYLDVYYDNSKVGTLAFYNKYQIAFEYDTEWIANGFSISPFSLSLKKNVFIPTYEPFGGIYGVFNDSLPDGWGKLLVDRYLIKNNIDPATINSLNRLSMVGANGMGALTYKPNCELNSIEINMELDKLAEECSKILKTDYSDNLDELFVLGGSSGGARPKILTRIDGEEWIIKFPSSQDSENIGYQEYVYSQCAKECGIDMPETQLFSSNICDGYFGVKRFDRIKTKNGLEKKIHMVSVSGLLEVSHRIPNLDYNVLMKLTLELTKDFSEVEKMFRIMCFNVFAHNRDDHSKNFSFLYDDNEDLWRLSPAYDLTYSNSIGGEHATMVNGNGVNPGIEDILGVAKNIGINESKAKNIAENVKECVREMIDL